MNTVTPSPSRRRLRLHRAQTNFLRSSALYRGFVGGRSTGKSYIGALALIAHAKPDRTYLVAAPTYPMLQDSSLRSFLKIGRDLGVLDLTHIKKAPPPAVRLVNGAEVLFRSADNPEKLRGPNLSGVWLDEASLMVKDAYDISIACLREEGQQGWLWATFTPKGSGHWTYELFGQARRDTELFHARTEDNPFNPPEFSATLAGQYGADSLFAQQELSGEFVDSGDGWQCIPTPWVRAAQARWTPHPPEGQPLSCLGVDVAYGGADCTAIVPRYGPWFGRAKKYRGTATDSGQKAAFLVLREHQDNAPVHVDVIGYGAACYEALADKLGRNAVAINVSQATELFDRSKKYKLTNIRAAMYWKLREALDPETGDNLALPPDPELLGDLTAARFEARASGIVLESKDAIKERLGRSPDVGDALCLSHWIGKRKIIFGA